VRPTFLRAMALGLSIGAAGCSGGAADPHGSAPTPASDTPPVPGGPTGSVGLELTLPGGAQIATVDWVIAGPDGASTVVQGGAVDVHASGGATFLVSQLPAATGYRIVLSAASDGGVSCEGSATFAILPHATTQVAVQMECTLAGTGGQSTLVNGTTFDCAAWSSVSASPVETTVGNSVSLSATANGPVPANLTYSWSASSGHIGSPSAATTSFTCTAAGPASVTLVVGDGTVPEGSTCNPALDTDTITVTCAPATSPPPAAPALPPWALVALALGTMGLGARTSRRKSAPT